MYETDDLATRPTRELYSIQRFCSFKVRQIGILMSTTANCGLSYHRRHLATMRSDHSLNCRHTMNNLNPPLGYNAEQEERIRVVLQALQTLFEIRIEARRQGNIEELPHVDRQIPAAMRRIGDAYPDQQARAQWYRDADEFESANPEEREHILMPIAKGLGILIATPFVLAGGIAGGAVFAAGAILYGAGKVVQGIGSLLTGGNFQ